MQGVIIWLGHKGGHFDVLCHIGLNKQKATQDVLLSCLARGITTNVVNVGVVVQWSAKRTHFAQFPFAAALLGAKVSLNTNLGMRQVSRLPPKDCPHRDGMSVPSSEVLMEPAAVGEARFRGSWYPR